MHSDVASPVASDPVNADQRHWEVPVAANGKTELTVTFLTPW